MWKTTPGLRTGTDIRKEGCAVFAQPSCISVRFYLDLRDFGLGCPFDIVFTWVTTCGLYTFVGAGLWNLAVVSADATFGAAVFLGAEDLVVVFFAGIL